MRILSFVVASLLLAASPASAVTVQFGASKDNTLYENQPALSNGAGEHLFAGRTGQVLDPVRRGLIAFDVSSIPAGATIDAVRLTLNMSKTPAGNEIVSLYRVLANWGEGTSDAAPGEGGGAAATTGDATWQYTFYNTSSWATLGGDFLPLESASKAIGIAAAYTFGSTPDLVADVQYWLDDPSENFGWILRGNEGAATATSKRFDTKDNSTPANRPILEVDYTPSAVGVEGNPLATRRLELLPVVPNPAATAASFRFRLAAAAVVHLGVYDASGRRVAELAHREMQAGEHAVAWEAGAAPRGAYWVRLEAGGAVTSRGFRLTRSR